MGCSEVKDEFSFFLATDRQDSFSDLTPNFRASSHLYGQLGSEVADHEGVYGQQGGEEK